MSNASETRVPCSKATRERLWNAKQGGESFDALFRKMLEQYDKEQAEPGETTKASA